MKPKTTIAKQCARALGLCLHAKSAKTSWNKYEPFSWPHYKLYHSSMWQRRKMGSLSWSRNRPFCIPPRATRTHTFMSNEMFINEIQHIKSTDCKCTPATGQMNGNHHELSFTIIIIMIIFFAVFPSTLSTMNHHLPAYAWWRSLWSCRKSFHNGQVKIV